MTVKFSWEYCSKTHFKIALSPRVRQSALTYVFLKEDEAGKGTLAVIALGQQKNSFAYYVGMAAAEIFQACKTPRDLGAQLKLTPREKVEEMLSELLADAVTPALRDEILNPTLSADPVSAKVVSKQTDPQGAPCKRPSKKDFLAASASGSAAKLTVH